MPSPHSRRTKNPRISANDLALFMVSSDTARMGIIRRSREPRTHTVIRYKDVRDPICSFLSDPHHNLNPLNNAEAALKQRSTDPAVGSMLQEDALLSVEVLHAIQSMRNSLAQYVFVAAPKRQPKLVISGVEVSVRADLLVHAKSSGVDQVGAAILRMTKDDTATDTAKEKRKKMGQYVATLSSMHMDQNIPTDRKPINKLCMSIDVQHGEIFVAPAHAAQRVSNMENACQVISAFWKTA